MLGGVAADWGRDGGSMEGGDRWRGVVLEGHQITTFVAVRQGAGIDPVYLQPVVVL